MPKTVRLRGHHLLCVLAYRGFGYTPDFVANYDMVVATINAGAEIEIVTGVDDICGALRQGNQKTCDHALTCRGSNTKQRDRLALKAVARALQLPKLEKGDVIKLGAREIAILRRHYQHGSIRQACTACSWHEFCSQIARENFKDTKLIPAAVPR